MGVLNMDDFYSTPFDWNAYVLATTSTADIRAEALMIDEERQEAEWELQARTCDSIYGDDAWEILM